MGDRHPLHPHPSFLKHAGAGPGCRRWRLEASWRARKWIGKRVCVFGRRVEFDLIEEDSITTPDGMCSGAVASARRGQNFGQGISSPQRGNALRSRSNRSSTRPMVWVTMSSKVSGRE
ncbi:DUF5818 domain-containing protein [Aquabacter sediminis]|uniref:DUF5818 domain-containing protein n=1 Tax=Aquabacter sediminis TaxID=3029197 RepID=UPI003CCFF2CD